MAYVKVENLRKEYQVAGRTEVAVEDINFEVGEGEFLTLVGPSGCGKSTTLRCIAGLETPTSGKIMYDGEDITDVPANERNLAMMFQDIALYPHMTSFDNIAYPLKINSVSKSDQRKQVEDVATTMQISELLDKYPGELSGGQQQRVALARTIVQSPRAFLMDEPLSDLDAKLQVEVRKEVQQVHNRLKKPTVYVTHNQEEAITMSDNIAVMNKGKIEQLGDRAELYHYPANIFVANFIGNPSMNFLNATVESLTPDSGAVSMNGVPYEFNVNYLDKRDLTEVVIGIRPISITLEHDPSADGFTGQIALLEPIDDRAQVTVTTDQGEVIALIPAENNFSVGDNVELIFDTENLYLFDPNTETLAAKSGSATNSNR